MNVAGSSTQLSGSSSLDDVLNRITTSDNLSSLNGFLKSFTPKESRETILSSTLGSGQDPLDVLDPQRNTLGYLYILSARLNSNTTTPPTLAVIETFCRTFDPAQARWAPDRVTMLAKGIQRASEASNNPKYALAPLSDLVRRYPPKLSYLTTLHTIFVRLCVATGHFTAALPVLSEPITHVEMSLSDLTYNDNLIYHYSGGVALGALKRWREAEDYFEICVSAPAVVPAAIQLEAYKKLVLVQLIQYGETVPLPKYALPAIQRLFKNTPYNNFLKNYPSSLSGLRAFVAKENELLQQEHNLGLINQAIERAPVWLVKKLTATYLTLGLSDIGKQVGIDSAEEVREIIISMIDSGEINGSISADDTVTFSDPVPQFTKDELDTMLVTAQANSLTLLDTERTLNASKEYLTKVMKHKDDASWGADEDMFLPSLGQGGPWTEDSMFG